MKKLLLALLVFASPAFAEVPPPGTARKGPIVVTPEGMDTHEYDLSGYKVVERNKARAFNLKRNKEVADLKKRIRDLEAENDRLANRALPTPISKTRTVERVVQKEGMKPFTIYGIGGVMPDGVHIDKQDMTRKAEIHEHGTAVGLGGMYHFESGLSAGVQAQVTTRSTYLTSYAATVGWSFGSR